jgi:putative transposase
MHLTPGEAYHIFNRGNNSRPIFFNERNYFFFLEKIKTQLAPVCEILCWCLMPNHFHLIIYATEKTCSERPSFGGKPMQEFPFQIGILLSSYSQAINKQNKTTGSLFQQKTKANCLTGISGHKYSPSDNYLLSCTHYIHQNPLKAGLVRKIEDWPYCSFRNYIGTESRLFCYQERLFSMTGLTGADFYNESYQAVEFAYGSDRWERPDP